MAVAILIVRLFCQQEKIDRCAMFQVHRMLMLMNAILCSRSFSLIRSRLLFEQAKQRYRRASALISLALFDCGAYISLLYRHSVCLKYTIQPRYYKRMIKTGHISKSNSMLHLNFRLTE